MNNLPFKGQMARKEEQGNPYKTSRDRDCPEITSSILVELKVKVVSFQIENTAAVSYLQMVGSIHYGKPNALVRQILLRCQKDRVAVCPKYF